MVNMNNDFKLNLYFQLYKDMPIVNRNHFRYRFTKKNGKFDCINELMFMIEEYQREKYGNLVTNFVGYAPSKKKKGRK